MSRFECGEVAGCRADALCANEDSIGEGQPINSDPLQPLIAARGQRLSAK
jgi:hypothetical protein